MALSEFPSETNLIFESPFFETTKSDLISPGMNSIPVLGGTENESVSDTDGNNKTPHKDT